jgi:hypothetical protein
MSEIANNTGRDHHSRSESYPSPSPTVSPGHSPHVHETNPPALPISRTSELAFALQTNDGQVRKLDRTVTYSDAHFDARLQPSATSNDIHYHKPSDPPTVEAGPRGFGDNGLQHVYGEASHAESSIYSLATANGSSSSSLGVPSMDYPDKYRYDGDTIAYSTTGHYEAYPPPVNGHYTVETNFSNGDGHHVSGFGPSSEVYPTYNADPCNNASSIENPLESLVPYT